MLLSFPAEADNQKKALDAAIQIQSALEILHELPVKDVLLAKAEVHGETTLLLFGIMQLNLSVCNLLMKMTQELKQCQE